MIAASFWFNPENAFKGFHHQYWSNEVIAGLKQSISTSFYHWYSRSGWAHFYTFLSIICSSHMNVNASWRHWSRLNFDPQKVKYRGTDLSYGEQWLFVPSGCYNEREHKRKNKGFKTWRADLHFVCVCLYIYGNVWIFFFYLLNLT